MAIENPSTFVSLLLGIHLLFCCCFPASGRLMNNNTDDSQSGSRSARQYVVPVSDPYAHSIWINYQPQTPSNIVDRWIHGLSNIPTISQSSSDVETEDEILFSTRQQQQFRCGRGPAALPQRQTVGIVGGSEAVKNSWPFIVALRDDGEFLCGGSLISTNKVLTAAHCVEKLTSHGVSTLTVSLGMHTIGDPKLGTKNDAQMTRRVSRVIMHNGYNTVNQIDDIAILILESPVVYSDAISPVCLAPANTNPDQYAGKDVAIIGWGKIATFPVTKNPDVLQQGTNTVISNAECKMEKPLITKNSICVFKEKNRLCKGDSGGPVIYRTANGAWTQVGIVSYGNPICIFNTVLTRVSAYRNWIDHYMK